LYRRGNKKTFTVKNRSNIFATTFQNNWVAYSSVNRKLIAGLLLVLYGFVAMPVSLWHQHKKLSGDTIPPESKKEYFFCKATDETADGNCKICAHQYQLHHNDAVSLIGLANCFIVSKKSLQGHFTPQPSVSRFLNRGPPALI
jgi:hypothetical protein